jgi:hypothetical protein
MNPNHLAALWFNEWARTAWLWSRWLDDVALELWGV